MQLQDFAVSVAVCKRRKKKKSSGSNYLHYIKCPIKWNKTIAWEYKALSVVCEASTKSSVVQRRSESSQQLPLFLIERQEMCGVSDDIDGSGRIKHSLRSDTIYAALEGTLIRVCLYLPESLPVIQMLHQMVREGPAIKSSRGCLGVNKGVRVYCTEP